MKKAIIYVMIMILTVSSTAVFAQGASSSYDETLVKAESLVTQLEIMTGDTDGNMRLEDNMTRAEFTKAAIMASPYKSGVALNMPLSPYSDVPYTHWAAPYIKLASDNGLVNGYVDSTFRPEENILFEEAVTVALNFLGYTESDYGSSWPYGQISIADRIGLSDNISSGQGEAITRADAVILFYNLMNCNTNGTSTKYINSIGYTYYEDAVINGTSSTDPALEEGEVSTTAGVFTCYDFDDDYFGLSGDMLVNGKGEILSFTPDYIVSVADSSWMHSLGVSSDSLTCVRDGKTVDSSEILSYDILYYYPASSTVQAYSKKVTAIYESASPNKETPTSITASGVTYNIETYDAFKQLSSTGDFSYGDTLVLLLGKNGDVAGVAAPTDNNVTKYGFLIDSGKKETSDSVGNAYNVYYATLVLTDGTTSELTVNKDYSSIVNSVVKIDFSGETAALSSYRSSSNVSGTVNSDTYTIGSSPLSSSVEILEVDTTDSWKTPSYKRVYLQRLDGINISSSSILLAVKDAAGKVTNMIVKDVTGDLSDYGMLLSDDSGGTYTIDIDGVTSNYSSGGSSFSVSGYQPVKVTFDGNQLASIRALSKVASKVTSFDNSTVTAGDTLYPLSEEVKIYKKTTMGGVYNYMLITMDELREFYENDDCKITAYYDKSISSGGRIRVLIAE